MAVDQDPNDEPTVDRDGAHHAPDHSEDRFVWPPRPIDTQLVQAPDSPTAVVAPPAPPSQVSALLRRLERALTKPTIEPIARQKAERNWSRDTQDLYCARCGRSVGPAEEDEFGCSVCRSSVLPYTKVVRLGEYADPIDRWIWALKFQRLRRFGEFLGRELADALGEVGVLENPPPAGVAIQPIPTSTRRRISRGIDHASVIACACGSALNVPVLHALRRTHRPSQRSVPPSMRWENARDTMRVLESRRADLTGRRIVVIDDVLTSGATARSAALVLQGRPDARYAPAVWGAAEVWHATIASAESR